MAQRRGPLESRYAKPMWTTLRSVVPSAIATVTVAAAVFGSAAPAVQLTAEALIVGGTGIPNPSEVTGYTANAIINYIKPTTPSCEVVCVPKSVPYIAQWWPFPMEGWGGLKGTKFNPSVDTGVTQLTSDLVGTDNPSAANPIVIAGFSQGSVVSSLVKTDLTKLSAQEQANISFNLLANLARPNGGVLERFPFLGTVPIWEVTFGQPTVTNTSMATTDISFQYDGVSDFPRYPINALAALNALAGMVFIHPTLMGPNGRNEKPPAGLTPEQLSAAIADPANRQRFGDTTYITIPTANLPLLDPIRYLGALTHTEFLTTPLIDLIQPALRVLIEAGYDRTTPYGQPAPMRLIPRVNPITLTVDVTKAVGQGVKAALSDIGIGKPAQNVTPPAAVAAGRSVAGSAVAALKAARALPAPPASAVTSAGSSKKSGSDRHAQPVSTGPRATRTAH